MHAQLNKQLWYYRHNETVRGPFPAGLMRRFLLVGRMTNKDLLSSDGETWMPVSEALRELPEPPMSPAARMDPNRDLILRLREDERSGIDRRARADAGPLPDERRSTNDRRCTEPEDFSEIRAGKTDLLRRLSRHGEPATRLLMGGAGVFALIMLAGLLAVPGPGIPPADCEAAGAPAVNWSNCFLEGADLRGLELAGVQLRNTHLIGADLRNAVVTRADISYANLVMSDLRNTDLSGSSLFGASLRGANLSGANLKSADLSYANLRGADLQGVDLESARLDHAIWIDGTVCGPGSIGRCNAVGGSPTS